MNAPKMAIAPSSWPRDDAAAERMLVVRNTAIVHARVRDLADELSPGDLLVVNDAGTIPASFVARVEASGETLEVRLAQEPVPGKFVAVLFGNGDFRTRTEDRATPPVLGRRAVLTMATGRRLRVVDVDRESPRLVVLETGDREAFLRDLYAVARPVQYAHVPRPLPLYLVQTPFADRPFAFEMPSASRALGFGTLAALKRRRIEVASITHAAGLSATGDPRLDARLPLAERYVVGPRVVAAIANAKANRRRIVAAGTSVVRALESAVRRGPGRDLEPHEGLTELRIGPGHRLQVVDALLTGIHVPGESHHDLLGAFAPPALLERAVEEASARGYLAHEFGDAMLLHASA